jgi:hypothetical protein
MSRIGRLFSVIVLIPGAVAYHAAYADPDFMVQDISPPEQGFYSRIVDSGGIAVKSNDEVSDRALILGAQTISTMLENIPDVRAKLVQAHAELHIIGKNQLVSDLPENSSYKGQLFEGNQTVDQRTRGLGGLLTSCGEENLLNLPQDRYAGRNICVHEFAHNIQNAGLSADARQKLSEQYQRALSAGLWRNSYAATNEEEFFAELSMWYFGTHGDEGMDGIKPGNGPEGLRQYDPDSFALLKSIYGGD